MAAPFEQIAELDRVVHEPARLAILTALAACKGADFLFLQRLTGLTNGNLSSHLSKLEEAGFVMIEKEFVAKRPSTSVSLTRAGRSAIERHWIQLDKLRRETRDWSPEKRSERGW